MAFNLGLGLSVGIGALFIAIGVLLFVSKKAKAWVKAVPLVNKLPVIIVAVALLVIGFSAGGVSWYQSTLQGATASVTGVPQTQAGITATSLSCKFVDDVKATSSAVAGNLTTALDVNDASHYTMYLKNATGNGAGSFFGNLTCSRTGDVDKAVAITCYAIGDTFRNEVSTTDTNAYNIVATTNAKSSVAGVPWKQTIYLQSGNGATTSSDREDTQFSFASATASQKLGFYFTIAGDTAYNYLNSYGATPSVTIYCNNKVVGRVTISKVGALV